VAGTFPSIASAGRSPAKSVIRRQEPDGASCRCCRTSMIRAAGPTSKEWSEHSPRVPGSSL